MSVAPPVLYIADPADETLATRWIDLNGSAFGIIDGTFDWGEDSTQFGWVGNVQSRAHRGPKEVTFRLFLNKRSTVAAEQLAVATLNEALDAGGVLVSNMGGFSEVEYVDFYRSPLTRLFRAEERNLWHVLGLLKDPDGLPVTIFRAPARRLGIRNAEENLAANPALVELGGSSIPVGWAWVDSSHLSNHGFSWRFRAYTFTMLVAGETDELEQVVPIGDQDGGTAFTFAFESAASYSGNAPVIRAEIDWLDPGGIQVGATEVGPNAAIVFGPSFGFNAPNVSAVAPAGSSQALLRMHVERPAPNGLQTMYLRSAQLREGSAASPFRVGLQAVSNLTKRAWMFNPGNTEGLVQARVAPETGSLIERISLCRRSGRSDVREFAAIGQGLFVDADLHTGASIQSDADAGTGEAVRIVHTSGMTRSLRVNVPQVGPATLEGRHVLRFAMRLQTGVDSYRYQIRWGVGDVDALPYPGEVIPADTTDPTTAPYVSVPMVAVNVPHGVSGLYFEVWSSAPASAETYLDDWWLEPTESVTVARVPGVGHPGKVITRRWDPDELVTPGAVVGSFSAGELLDSGDYLLVPDSPDQAVGAPPVGGIDFADVRHQLVADLNTFNDAGDERVLGQFRVHDLSADLQVAAVSIKTVKGQRWREVAPEIKFKPTPGNLYMPYVVLTAAVSSNIHVRKLTDTFSPEVSGTGDQTAALDGDSRRAYVLEGGEVAGPLDLDPPFLDARPGLQLVRIDLGDATPFGWEAVFPFAVQAHVASRRATLALNVVPRIQ